MLKELDSKFYEKYLIANTTKEQRQYHMNNSNALVALGGTPLSDKIITLSQKYIDGEMELIDMHKELIS